MMEYSKPSKCPGMCHYTRKHESAIKRKKKRKKERKKCEGEHITRKKNRARMKKLPLDRSGIICHKWNSEQ